MDQVNLLAAIRCNVVFENESKSVTDWRVGRISSASTAVVYN